ncbi:unnamed protein product [Rotaria sp. Silwood2]|nr:unnamed protein product [Rotaria sp. Silwood2]CAF4394601.1 unnamed protein product [Rotaria sp. Silwood2]
MPSFIHLIVPEYQTESNDITKEKAILTTQCINDLSVVEHTSLHFDGLYGLPCPYIKWYLDKLYHDRLNILVADYYDPPAYAYCICILCWAILSTDYIY